MSKRSRRREEAARQQAAAQSQGFVHSAADRVGPLVHSAADLVTPLAQSAVDRMGPLAEAAVERIAPLATQAIERVTPYAQSTRDLMSPYTQSAAGRISPLASSAAEKIVPLAGAAALKLGPVASSARERGSQVAHDAAEKYGPRLDEALELVGPALGAARGRVTDAVTAAAGSEVLAEAARRSHATLAAARGELVFPEPVVKKKGRWLRRLAVVTAVGGVVVVAARRFLGSNEPDWQAARPSTPYAPPRAAEPQAEPGPADGPEATEQGGDVDEPRGEGLSAHELNLDANGETAPEAPAEGGDAEVDDELADLDEPESTQRSEPVAEAAPITVFEPAPESVVIEPLPEPGTAESADDEAQLVFTTASTGDSDTLADEFADAGIEDGTVPPEERPRYEGEGVYVGNEPPEGFVIKGNERSKKYHLPDSGGYSRTIAEVWFSSEDAARAAGFVRAQR